jgi:heptosyltransferase-2
VNAPARLLVVAPSWLGDAVMATPALLALRTSLPNARIVLLCRPGIDGVLNGLGAFDEAIVDRMGGWSGPLRAAARLRRERCDAALLLPNSFRSAFAVALAGIPRRIGYRRNGRSWLLRGGVERIRERPFSTIDLYAELVELGLGIEVADRAPRLVVTEAERARGRALLGDLADRPFALLIPGGNKEAKRWPAERFAAVADALAERHGLAIAASGSPGERPIVAALRAAARRPIVDLIERGIELPALKAIAAAARVVIGNDTGPRHVALALGTPTVTLFGPTDHRWTIVRGAQERLLVAEPFLPEELVADDRPGVCAIDRIAVGDVLAAVDSILTDSTETAR